MHLSVHSGTDRDRLEKEIGRIRYEYLESVKVLAGTEADDYLELATSPMKVYRVDVFGTNASLRDVLGRSDVMAVFPDISKSRRQ